MFAAGATECPTNITYEAAEQEEFDVDYYVPDFKSLYEFADENQIRDWVSKWREMRMLNKSDSVVKEWFANLRNIHGPHVTGNEECTMLLELFRAEWKNLPKQGAYYRREDTDCPPSGPM